MMKTNIVIAVSFVGSSKKDYKIALAHTFFSTVRLTTVGDTKRAGTRYIPSRVLKQMFVNSGQKVIEATLENGNDPHQIRAMK